MTQADMRSAREILNQVKDRAAKELVKNMLFFLAYIIYSLYVCPIKLTL